MRNIITGFFLSLIAVAAIADGHVINRSLAFDPPSLDPNVGTASVAGAVLSDLVDGLVIRGPDGQPVPGCAEGWVISQDGLTYTFTLREGLEWSDGQPLVAADFVYSFHRLLSPETGAPAAGLFFIIDGARELFTGAAAELGVSAPDDRTVVIRLARPAPYFIQLLANTQGVPVPRHAIEKHGRDWTRAGNMVSNGAYVLAERIPQDSIRLVKNPRFHAADSVTIDQVVWLPTPDLGANLRRFRAGELDTVLNFAPTDLPWVTENLPEALHMGPMQATYLLVVNVRQPPFDDARVRRALSLAIDREAITNKLLKTGVRPALSLVTPGTGGYPGNPDLALAAPIAERQAQAKVLLAEAGFDTDNPLVVPIVFDNQEENRKIMVALDAMWREIGVTTEASGMEFSAVLKKMRTGDFVLARSATFALFDDPYAFLQQFMGPNPRNWTGYASREFDGRLMQANATGDMAERTALLARAESVLSADQPMIPIYWYAGRTLVSPRITGWYTARLGTPMTRYLGLQ